MLAITSSSRLEALGQGLGDFPSPYSLSLATENTTMLSWFSYLSDVHWASTLAPRLLSNPLMQVTPKSLLVLWSLYNVFSLTMPFTSMASVTAISADDFLICISSLHHSLEPCAHICKPGNNPSRDPRSPHLLHQPGVVPDKTPSSSSSLFS